jgi:glutaredoxin
MFKRPKQRLSGHTLYCRWGCGACISVRLAAWWNGITLQYRDTGMSEEYELELTNGGGKKQVPCLRIDEADGTSNWLYEAQDIIDYLKAQID